MKKKVFLIGLNLYSIFLSLKIKSNFKNLEVTILEGSDNFLQAYKHLKIGDYFVNPGFHAFEDVRSKLLLNFLKKNIKFKKLKKTRGMIIDDFLISCQDKYLNWPKEIRKKFKLKRNTIIYSHKKNKNVNYLDKKFIKYLKESFSDYRTSSDNAIGLSYPWFFPPNYKLKSKDEASIFNQKIRDKKINHVYVFPKRGRFEDISKGLHKLLKQKNIKIKLKTPLKFLKQKKNVYFEGYKELNNSKNIKIICIPIKPLSMSVIDGKVQKAKKLKSIKYFTGLVEVKNFIKSDLDKFTEIIIASKAALGLKRISLYSDVFEVGKKKIYQIEFLEHLGIPNIKKQIKNILSLMSKFIEFKNKKDLKKNINLIGYHFVRNVFGPKEKDLKFIKKKMVNFFSKKKGIIFPRQIEWPINTNKHFIYAGEDYEKKIKNKLK
jgi:hypothetical protein